MFYYWLSSFLVNTLVFMMQGVKILTPMWLTCIILGVLIMALVDRVFTHEIDSDGP